VLADLTTTQFTEALAVSEVALGGTLLVPMVGDGLAGLGLTAFAGGLFELYLKTPGLRKEESLAPSQQGTGIAKDEWLFGMGLSLVTGALLSRHRG
jgi:hypothetical protein